RRIGPAAFLDYDHLTPAGARLTADVLLESGLLPDAEAAPAVLSRALRDDRSPAADGVRAWLAAREGPLPADGARVLGMQLTAADAELRRAAAWALEHAHGGAALETDALVHALREDPSNGVRAAAAQALGTLGASARGPVPWLLDALGDPSEAVRHEAARALSALHLAAEDVPRLTAALASPDDYVAAFAAWSLGNLGTEARTAVPALARALAREKTDAVVSGALARIGPGAVDAVPVLVGFLETGSPDRRWRAARTLGRIGPPAVAAVPALTAAVGDPESLVRLHAVRALGRVGPAARPAAAVLQRATGDPDDGVRREARQALDRLH
ncbi:MAG: HEAT repeat domain-containing protein, partial [Betaproteobacteria bacterium]